MHDIAHVQPLLTTAAAAERLGVTASTISRWVSAGKLTPAIKGSGLRGPMWFRASDVDDLTERQAS
jgi:excisionase family DNA binding protein